MRDGLHTDSYGTKRWYLDGERHRTVGPAIEYADGDKCWYLNGNLHRTDGPAVELANGDKEWYLNGKRYSFNKWLEANNEITDSQKVLLKLRYG